MHHLGKALLTLSGFSLFGFITRTNAGIMRKSLLKLLLIGIFVGATSLSARADPITLGTSNEVFCFSVGNNTAILVTINLQCGETSFTNVTGSATSSGPGAPTSGTYTLEPLANNPAFMLISPSTNGNTTTFGVDPNSPHFNFTYEDGTTTFLTGTLQFTELSQTTDPEEDPLTTGEALFTYSSSTAQFADFMTGGTSIMHFSFGGGPDENFITMFSQMQDPNGNEWQGISAKYITDGTLTPTPPTQTEVPEPSTLLLLGTGLAGLGAISRIRRKNGSA